MHFIQCFMLSHDIIKCCTETSDPNNCRCRRTTFSFTLISMSLYRGSFRLGSAVECHYNVVRYITWYCAYRCRKWGRISIGSWTHKRQPIPRKCCWRVNYGMSFMNILEKINRVITHGTVVKKMYKIRDLSMSYANGLPIWPYISVGTHNVITQYLVGFSCQ